MHRQWTAAIVTALWALALVVGLGLLYDYTTSPGAQEPAPGAWPDEVSLDRSGGWDVLVFVHPRCPCTVATIRQIERVQPLTTVPVRYRVVATMLEGVEAEFEEGRVIQLARSLRAVEVVLDPESMLARRFGALTSGHVCVYDPEGRLRFSGGVTLGRNHEGDNLGSSALIGVLSGRPTPVERTDVYGCPLLEDTPGPSAHRDESLDDEQLPGSEDGNR